MLLEMKTKEFVDAVASKSPAPGGGSVSALAGSLGASLTAMVGNLTIGRKRYREMEENQQKSLDANFDKAVKSMEVLNDLVQKDTTAFNGVMEAMKMTKETEEEKTERKRAIEEATKEALEIPLEVAKECLEVLKLQKVFGEYGNPNAITDVGVGALLAYSGLEGALLNVLVNLQGISDPIYVDSINQQCEEIREEGNLIKENTLKIVYSKLK